MRRRIAGLDLDAANPALWNDPERARAKMAELQSLRGPLERVAALRGRIADLDAMVELSGENADDPEFLEEAAASLQAAEDGAHDLEMEMLLSGPHDASDAILAVHPGEGGTESQDWAEMLFRMYRRWGEAKGLKTEVLDFLEGEEAGIKSATLALRGPHAYGFLRSEKGVHRLVRMSPFDASGRRHTSFASVDVLPDLPPDEGLEIRPEDLEIDRFRASGAGGQHVNRTESAVRVRHLPTGIIVTCQNERSQHSNLDIALTILRARLVERQAEERDRAVAELRGPMRAIGFGSQIRSYVFAPYQMVKDHRTEAETSNVQAVMDGAIDPFVEAYLLQRRREAGEQPGVR